RSQPLILNATSPAVDDIELDLPGETFADWYPDGEALLIGHEYRGRTELYRYDLGTRALERLSAEPGTIVAARVHPDGDVWYQLTSARTPAATHALSGGIVLRPPGAPAPPRRPFRGLRADGLRPCSPAPRVQAP